MADREQVVAELRAILRDVWREHPDAEVDPGATLRELGITSSVMLTLLVRIEERFAFRWDPDLAPGALRSLDAVAAAVLDAVRPAGTGGAP